MNTYLGYHKKSYFEADLTVWKYEAQKVEMHVTHVNTKRLHVHVHYISPYHLSLGCV